MQPERQAAIEAFLTELGFHAPFNFPLYHLALTHSSFTYENRVSPLDNYERLEFLGDAVLKLIVSEYLYERFPDYREGELTKIRAVIVSDAKLAEFAQTIGLGDMMIFGSSEARTGGRRKVSNLACGFESLLGALFLDGKMAEIHAFLSDLLAEEITRVDLDKTKDNYKAVLQEWTQAEGGALPLYKTVNEVGPPHNRRFLVEVMVNDEVVGHGSGKSKKEAQQAAAKMALTVLNQWPTDEGDPNGTEPEPLDGPC
jgi:ribonuclease-3